jgi:hypothetical protein
MAGTAGRAVDAVGGQGTGRAQRAAAAKLERTRRHQIARRLAQDHGGVVTRAMLLGAGLTRGQIQVEVEHGVWVPAGRHVLCISTVEPQGEALWWRALWESGGRSLLDGATALVASGLTGWSEKVVHVSVPNSAHVRALPGVVHHRLRDPGDHVRSGLRRTKPYVAAIRAAQWAASDRQAATIVAMTVQQRLTSPAALLGRWAQVGYSVRRRLLDDVIRDVCDGAHSLGELDFTGECRRRGLPAPSRQVVRTGRRGRVYLDVFWDELGVHVEIQGAQHFQGTAQIDDALRLNHVGMLRRDLVTLQIPVLGLRTCPDAFMDQVAQALATGRRRSG